MMAFSSERYGGEGRRDLIPGFQPYCPAMWPPTSLAARSPAIALQGEKLRSTNDITELMVTTIPYLTIATESSQVPPHRRPKRRLLQSAQSTNHPQAKSISLSNTIRICHVSVPLYSFSPSFSANAHLLIDHSNNTATANSATSAIKLGLAT